MDADSLALPSSPLHKVLSMCAHGWLADRSNPSTLHAMPQSTLALSEHLDALVEDLDDVLQSRFDVEALL